MCESSRPHCITHCFLLLCCITLYYTILYSTTLCYTILSCVYIYICIYIYMYIYIYNSIFSTVMQGLSAFYFVHFFASVVEVGASADDINPALTITRNIA